MEFGIVQSGCWVFGFCIVGCWGLEFGFFDFVILDFVILDFVFFVVGVWNLDIEFGILDSGLRIVAIRIRGKMVSSVTLPFLLQIPR